MASDLSNTLCTRCGLCCDGSLFADVELAGRAEAAGVEFLGLEIEDDDTGPPLLVQPCRALKGTLCSIYPHRPKCCRTFECRLLQDVRRGAVGVERARELVAEAQRRIARVKELMTRLGQPIGRLPLDESVAEALARGTHRDPDVSRIHGELEAAMTAVGECIRQTFLRGEPVASPLHESTR